MEGDSPEMQFQIGSYYYKKNDEEKTEKAHDWFLKAAEQGHMKSQYNVGSYYYKKKDEEKALDWFLRAAEQGHTEAQLNAEIISDGKKLYGDEQE